MCCVYSSYSPHCLVYVCYDVCFLYSARGYFTYNNCGCGCEELETTFSILKEVKSRKEEEEEKKNC